MTAPTTAITSLTNDRVKAAVRLRDRRERELTGRTIVDGARELGRALDAGIEVVEAFVCEAVVRSAEAVDVLDRLRSGSAPVVDVSEAVFAKIAFGDRADGVVAIIRSPADALDDLGQATNPLYVVVEAVEKPGNLGAILRTADGAGADALIAADPLTDVFNPNAVRASLGTIFTVPVATATTAEVLDWLVVREIVPIAARVDATTQYTDIDLRGPVAIILGSEADGLSDAWDDPRVLPVHIPMRGAADSLNVSIAAAILLYEAVRQRSQPPPNQE